MYFLYFSFLFYRFFYPSCQEIQCLPFKIIFSLLLFLLLIIYNFCWTDYFSIHISSIRIQKDTPHLCPTPFPQVPIVFGGADYSSLLPPGSYINALDFPSPKGIISWVHEIFSQCRTVSPRWETTMYQNVVLTNFHIQNICHHTWKTVRSFIVFFAFQRKHQSVVLIIFHAW